MPYYTRAHHGMVLLTKIKQQLTTLTTYNSPKAQVCQVLIECMTNQFRRGTKAPDARDYDWSPFLDFYTNMARELVMTHPSDQVLTKLIRDMVMYSPCEACTVKGA